MTMSLDAATTEIALTRIQEVRSLLSQFEDQLSNPELREQVRSLIPVIQAMKEIGSGLIPEASSARERILSYLRRYPMTLIDGDELMVVAGIGEWARRVRELRVQFGWWIYSGVTLAELAAEDTSATDEIASQLGTSLDLIRPDQYVLLNAEQDRDSAYRWNLINGIRRQPGGVKAKVLKFLRSNVGKPVTLEELRYLAGDKNEWARRVRELRTEEGWPIFTRMQGRPDLPVGSYVLDEDKQAPEHDRHIPDDVRVSVLERDRFSCVVCHWSRDQIRHEDPRKFIELHHIQAHAEGGENSIHNLISLCNVHHDQVHAGRLDVSQFLPPA